MFRRQSARFVIALILFPASMGCLTQPALAILYTFNNASAPWSSPASWTPNDSVNFPISGDHVFIDPATPRTVTVTGAQEFGSGSDPSFFARSTLNITGGSSLTMTAGTLNVNNAATSDTSTIQGGGTFVSQGTIITRSHLTLGTSGTQFISNAELQSNLSASQGVRNLTIATGTEFINQGSGFIRINNTNPNTNPFALVGGGTLTHTTGNPLFTITSGSARLAMENNGTLNQARLATLLDLGSSASVPAGSRFQLGGGWDEITLTGGDFNLNSFDGQFAIQSLVVPVTGTTVNVTTGSVPTGFGIRWTDGAAGATITAAPGRTFTNQGIMFNGDPDNNNTTATFTGGGTFLNQGTLGNRSHLLIDNDSTFINQGEFTLALSGVQGGRALTIDPGATFLNEGAGFIQVNNTNSVAPQLYTIQGAGTLTHTGSNPLFSFTNGSVRVALNNNGTLDHARVTSWLNFANPASIPTSSFLQLGGGWDEITLTGGDANLNVFDGLFAISSLVVPVTGTTVNVTTGNNTTGYGIRWTDGSTTATISTASGGTFTNIGTIVNGDLTSTTTIATVNGGGTFLNQGTLENHAHLVLSGSGTTLVNEGTVLTDLTVHQAGGTRNTTLNAGTVLDNQGLLASTTGTNTKIFTFNGSGKLIMNSDSALEVRSGITNVTNSVSLVNSSDNPVIGGNTLVAGEWRVLANSGANSTLDLQGFSANSITTIGADAGIVLSRTGANNASFVQMGLIDTVSGSLMVNNDQALTVAGSLAVSGTLGGDGTFTSPGTITFTGGTLDPAALNGDPGTLLIDGDLVLDDTTQLTFTIQDPNTIGGGVNDLVEIDGALTLDGVLDILELPGAATGTYRLFNYTGAFSENGVTLSDPVRYMLDFSTPGQVNLTVLPIPEPSTGLLLLCGLVALRRRKEPNTLGETAA